MMKLSVVNIACKFSGIYITLCCLDEIITYFQTRGILSAVPYRTPSYFKNIYL
jgi:hypothetical protein